MHKRQPSSQKNILSMFVAWITKEHFTSASVGGARDREYFIENLSMLIASGMDIVEALEAIKVDIHSAAMRERITAIQHGIASGMTLSAALAAAGVFSARTISLIRIGETSGQLAENLKVLAAQQEKDRLFKSKIRSALMYPVFVLGLTAIIGVGVAWFILPKLATVFAQLRLDLPFITRALIGIGSFLGQYGYFVVPLFTVFLVVIIYLIFYFPQTRKLGRKIFFWMPGAHQLIKEVEIARFGYLMGTLLGVGLPITQALHSVESATTFSYYQKLYRSLRHHIAEGNSFQKSFALFDNIATFIPKPIQQLVIAGEQSGNLQEVFVRISRRYESKIDATTRNLTVILEPVLLVIVWLGVVFVALAVILPIYNLIGGINTTKQTPVTSHTTGEVVIITDDMSQAETITPDVVDTFVQEQGSVTILPTGAGFLNVRSAPDIQSTIVQTVTPGESFVLIAEEEEWYHIEINDETRGWVSKKYTAKEIVLESENVRDTENGEERDSKQRDGEEGMVQEGRVVDDRAL